MAIENNEQDKDFPVKHIGRICYVDPNDVFGYGGENGSNDVPIPPSYEDMCIAFNLIIEKYSRFDNKERNEFGLAWSDKPNGQTTHFSVLEGELKTDKNGNLYQPQYNEKGQLLDSFDNSYLTTYYTEISADGYKRKEIVEGLGVESIQVNFDSYYTPTVTIKFVDVRGCALFGREEAIHSNKYGVDAINADNIFGAFFTIPYPKFRLQIKGFYGRDVTYQLTCSNFKANFNSKTGNVEATVTFIGYTWSLLTDIPLSYLIAAPYCNYIGKDYWETHKGTSEWRMENAADSDASEIMPPTLCDFFKKIRNCIKDSQSITSESAEGYSGAAIATEREKLEKIKNNINKFNNFAPSSKVVTSDVYTSKNADANDTLKLIIDDINNYAAEGETTPFAGLTIPTEGSAFTATTDGNYKLVDLEPILTTVNNRLSECDELKKQIDKEAEVEFVHRSLKEIGIDPNIYNIFKILICHLETFVHILFEAAKEIEEQKANGERTANALGVDFINTDMPERFNFDTTPLPPWTAIFNRDKSDDSNSDKLEYSNAFQWVGNLKHDWVEERVVWSLHKAIQETAPKQEQNEEKSNFSIENIFLLPSDILLGKPVFEEVAHGGFDVLCGALGLRAAQLFGIGSLYDATYASILGKVDAYNLYMSLNGADDIKNQIIEKIDNGNATAIIAGITICDDTYNSYATKENKGGEQNYFMFENDPSNELCANNGKSGRHPIFVKTNSGYEYVYFYDEDKLPLVPSRLVSFEGRGYDYYIQPQSSENGMHYEGIVKNNVANEWLYNDNSQVKTGTVENKYVYNFNEFKIIEDASKIQMIEDKYNEYATGNFTIKDYNVDDVRDFQILSKNLWLIAYKWYKNGLPDTIYAQLLGPSYGSTVSDFFKENKEKDNKTYTVADLVFSTESKWAKAIDGNNGNKEYSLGETFGQLTDGSETVEISNLFVKHLPIFNSSRNSLGSLFGHPFYYTQNVITETDRRYKAKAFLFLQCLIDNKVISDIWKILGGTVCTNLLSKSILLFIGGLFWRQKYLNENNRDGINYKNLNSKNTDILSFKPAIKNGKTVTTFGDGWGLEIENSKIGNTTGGYSLDDSKFDNNLKQQLIEYFEKFAQGEFVSIAQQCELRYYDSTTKTNKDFANGYDFQNWNSKKNKFVMSTDVYALWYINNGTAGGSHLLFNENNTALQNTIKDIMFGKVILLQDNGYNTTGKGNIVIPANTYEGYISSFVETLKKIYESNTTEGEEYTSTGLVEDIKVDTELLLIIYLYCKNIWEKWLMPLSGQTSTDVQPNGDMNENHFDVSHFFKENFVFIDSYYNDISKRLKVNLDTLLKSYEGRSENSNLFAFIGDIVSAHRCLFVGLPDYVSLGLGIEGETSAIGVERMKDMFRTLPYSKIGYPRMDNHFVVMYTYPPASQMPEEFSHKFDGFDIYSTDVVPDNFTNLCKDKEAINQGVTKYGYNVPAFCIAFGRQNNHIFKDFSISMDNPVETEQSIKTLYHIAELAKGSDRKVCFYGQDVYNIFSNYSYQIEVDMMGNAQIQPLMYFQLLNVPMWRGAYMIYNVSHNMTAGNMTTHIKAMKMSKNPVPLISSYWSWINNPNASGGSGSYGDGGYGYYDAPDFETSGQVGTVQDLGASSSNMDAFDNDYQKPCNKIDDKYLNRGHNNYYMPTLSTYTFKMNNGETLDLKKTINFIYNFAHYATHDKKNKKGQIIIKACTKKSVTASDGRCAGYVWKSLRAGGIGLGTAGGSATQNLYKDYLVNKCGYKQIYDENGTLPAQAMPGDIALQNYSPSGHTQLFTGQHWVSDAIQGTGLKWANSGVGLTAVFRIPGIENALQTIGPVGSGELISYGVGPYILGTPKKRIPPKGNQVPLTTSGKVSDYDDLFKKYGKQYDIDWRLLAAISFVESSFNPKKNGKYGVGLMGVNPQYSENSREDLKKPEICIENGSKILYEHIRDIKAKTIYKNINPANNEELMRFALAAYNAGLPGLNKYIMPNVKKSGKNPTLWYDNVELFVVDETKNYVPRVSYNYYLIKKHVNQ